MAEIIRNIIVVGDRDVGKSAWLKQIATDTFNASYTPSSGITVQSICIPTLIGLAGLIKPCMVVNLWDCADQDCYTERAEEIGANGVIIMYSSIESYYNCEKWISFTRESVPNIPIVLCENKRDGVLSPISVNYDELTHHSISAKTGHNLLAPINSLVAVLW